MKPAFLPWIILYGGLILMGVCAQKYIETQNYKRKQLKDE